MAPHRHHLLGNHKKSTRAIMPPPALRLFLADMPPAGAERVFTTLADLWTRQGLDVRLGLWQATGPLVSQVPPHVALDVVGDGLPLANAPTIEHAGRALARWMGQAGPHAALLTGMPWANAVGAAARRCGALRGHTWRFVWSERTEPQPFYGAMPPPERRVLDGYARLGARVSHAAIAVSRRCAHDMAQRWAWWPPAIAVLPNPLRAPQGDGALPPIFHAPRQGPLILTVGRLVPEKGHADLLHAFATVLAHHPRARLVLMGDGPLHGTLVALAQRLGVAQNTTFAGFGWDTHAAMARADVFAFPSHYEGLPNALIEALAAGVPIVSTGQGKGAGEILDHGRLGLLVPEQAPDALAHAILAQIHAPLEGGDAMLERFDPSGVAKRYLDVLSGVPPSHVQKDGAAPYDGHRPHTQDIPCPPPSFSSSPGSPRAPSSPS